MSRNIEFSLGEFYHIYSRGVEKRIIFLDNSDQERFVKLLYVCNAKKPVVFKSIQGLALGEIERGDTIVDIGAYCLMPNHFHLLLKEKQEEGISVFMGKVLTAYSMYFNKKYKRTGSLFESTFKATHADNDEYLKYLFSYTHLNPIKLIDPNWKENGIQDKERAENYLKSYKYSSFLDYLGEIRPENAIINKKAFPQYFEEYGDFEDFIKSWLTYAKEETIIL